MEDVSVNGVAIYNGRNGGAIRADLLNNSIVEDFLSNILLFLKSVNAH